MTAKKTSKAATGGNTPAHKVVTPESVRAAQPRVETAGETKGSDTNVARNTALLRAEIEALLELEEREQRDEVLLRQVLEALQAENKRARKATKRAKQLEAKP